MHAHLVAEWNVGMVLMGAERLPGFACMGARSSALVVSQADCSEQVGLRTAQHKADHDCVYQWLTEEVQLWHG